MFVELAVASGSDYLITRNREEDRDAGGRDCSQAVGREVVVAAKRDTKIGGARPVRPIEEFVNELTRGEEVLSDPADGDYWFKSPGSTLPAPKAERK